MWLSRVSRSVCLPVRTFNNAVGFITIHTGSSHEMWLLDQRLSATKSSAFNNPAIISLNGRVLFEDLYA